MEEEEFEKQKQKQEKKRKEKGKFWKSSFLISLILLLGQSRLTLKMATTNDFNREEKPADFLLPEAVKTWFTTLYTHMISGNIEEMNRLYDREFGVLTNNYFKQTKWPEPESIQSLVDNDSTFMTLYTQIYYRHIFSKLQAGVEAKFQSWKNYCNIFDGILDGTLEIDNIPAQWAYDIVGEFVYQYQSFCQYRIKVVSKSEGEIARFREFEMIWDTKTVLTYLNDIIKLSKINEVLEAQNTGDSSVKSPSDTLMSLGYFCLFGLSRAHVLYGDYYTSLRILTPIDFSKKGIYSKSPSCHISAFYHMGFAQMMLQRYADAVRTFSALIQQVTRSRQFYSRLSQYDQIMKMSDKGLALLAIAFSLTPGLRLDDQVLSMIREKYGDKLMKMQRGDMTVYREIFSFSCPQFIFPECNVQGSEMVVRTTRALDSQINTFLENVKQQEHTSTICSYLKLYRSIELKKYANFRDMDETIAQDQLIAFKLRNYQALQQFGGKVRTGKSSSTASVNFFISNDIIQVDEHKAEHRYGDYFIHHINKMKDIIDECYRI